MRGLKRMGFTLIELLVVIAIIALLISILAPALAEARIMAKAIQEQSLARQMMAAYAAYAYEHRDGAMPAAAHWDWIHGDGRYSIRNTDPMPATESTLLWHSSAKVYTSHFMSVARLRPHEMMLDKPTYAEFVSRQGGATNTSRPYTDYTSSSAVAAINWHPSLGINGVFVGGAYTHGGFRGVTTQSGVIGVPGPQPRSAGGRFYVTKTGDVRFPAKLLVFASARGGDVKDGSYWSWGSANPDSGTIRPGHWLVTAPKPHPRDRGGFGTAPTIGGGWSTNSNTFSEREVPSRWGMLHPRYNKKTVTAMFDGHVEMLGLADLRDMTRWSNYADGPDWNFRAAP